jgi:hypothetical protein
VQLERFRALLAADRRRVAAAGAGGAQP